MKRIFLLFGLAPIAFGAISQQTSDNLIEKLIEKHGSQYQLQISKGVNQAAQLWTEKDGDENEFNEFCLKHFIADEQKLDETLLRFEKNLETIYGHNHEITRILSEPTVLDMGDPLPIDNIFAEYNPFSHIQTDFFNSKLAFVILLNFPITTLEEKLEKGASWTREEWAATKLASTVSERIPSDVSQSLSEIYVKADDYIANYNIHMSTIVNDKNEHLFPNGPKLITHWGLRDELKSHYADKNGIEKQHAIYTIMLHIINQTIPQKTIDNSDYVWNPFSNTLNANGKNVTFTGEPNTRYQMLLDIFHVEHKVDPYTPSDPSLIDRKFNGNRQIPEQQFEELISSVLKSSVAQDVAKMVKKNIGRDLQPFDIWYSGFKSRSNISEKELDKIVGKKYPTVKAFQNDLPNILTKLGFDDETAQFLSTKITVDPSRGAGHASGAMGKEFNAHLRTRIPKDGMLYKGYNIAIHELGHNVEQVFSLNGMDHYMLNGVPNNAFTEAFAFVFQSRDLDILGKSVDDPNAEHLKALATFWSTCEIAAVGLVDMRVWNWMYEHPEADVKALKKAVIAIAKDVWNEYYAPLFGVKDSEILAIYSHMIAFGLYLPDYSLGHIIMFQIEDYLKGKNIGKEMERMCKIGNVTPDLWMQKAVGQKVSAEPLIKATANAVQMFR